MAHKVYIIKKSFFMASHHHKGMLDEVEHTHEFRYEVKLKGVTNNEGFLVDFRDVEKALNDLINKNFNYKSLNSVMQEEPTTENLAALIYNKLKVIFLDKLHSVAVYETPDNCVIYEGEDE
ncbi:6-pyruvoyl-tetrahydropterin synthase [Elusimicrobium simillimum]|uniref:6-carboxytetrahydropterin synthase n=1 Tax=Elusimicrobium simillimum TaxID=3143438 RepID=UPI003C704D5A